MGNGMVVNGYRYLSPVVQGTLSLEYTDTVGIARKYCVPGTVELYISIRIYTVPIRMPGESKSIQAKVRSAVKTAKQRRICLGKQF